MPTLSVQYPASPQNVHEGILQPTPTFKQEVFKVLGAIVFFILVYLIMVAAALLLAALCTWAGFSLIVALPKLVTLMIGIGLIGLGLMVVFFLFKFLFKRNKTDRSNLIEIKESDQPELFTFIRRVTEETQTLFPKKIYLSPDVNASVFYDSSFWSMFLPVRKNLQIGLGLVNSVNISEFKAILAHEFGHFSQRSMKLGSYVYNVNQIIYNLLFENDGYGRTLENWASVSGYFVFFANATIKIVVGMQWILRKVYSIVNKSYMSLSRQMEFHADTVAAYVTGSDHLITALRKLEVADTTYNNLFEFYNRWHKEGLKPDNLYPQHLEIMRQFAVDHSIPLVHGLPQVEANSFSHFNKTRVVVKDQWASHPSTDDREAHLRSLNIRTEAVPVSAWCVFNHTEELQKQVTEKIYQNVTFEDQPKPLDLTSFSQRFHDQVDKYKLNKQYKGYFDFRNISSVDLRKIEENQDNEVSSLEEILNETILALPYVIEGLKSDLNVLEAIQQETIPVTRFEFDGQKYRKSDAGNLITQLKTEQEEAEAQLIQTDERLIGFFIRAAQQKGQGEQLRKKYIELFQITAASDEDLKKYMQVMEDIYPIYQGDLDFSKVHQIMEKVKLNEVLIKERLGKLLDDSHCSSLFSEVDKKQVIDYLSKDLVYFREPHYNQDALAIFNDSMSIFCGVITDRNFFAKKDVLEWQMTFL